MDGKTLFPELDEQQRRAVITGSNAVVAAGAGSGKTKVLAARYAYLVMERQYPVEEILALTFTNKAANEMYSRIYTLLAAHRDNPEARRGLADFHRARIHTLDSFLAGIARSVSRFYGISPDFQCDDPGVRELALETALPFVLEHRDNPALQALLAHSKIRTTAEELFAETMVKHSPISNPLDFAAFIKIQGEEIIRRWDEKTKAAAALIQDMIRELGGVTKKTLKIYESLSPILLGGPPPDLPDIEEALNKNGFFPALSAPDRAEDPGNAGARFRVYFDFLHAVKSTDLRGGNSAELAQIVSYIKTLKGLYGELESLANMALQGRIITAVFPLMDMFQAQFNRKKREAGLLSFNDIAHLAVNALGRYPDIRGAYKAMFRAIMIDEFQDNNSLQRDLIFLLAEKPGRNAPGVPRTLEELSPGKMFFVGDEKQSIYRFRGADVSVFRSLSKTLSDNSAQALNLIYNYRSDPPLVNAFNRIFGGLDPHGAEPAGPGVFLRDDGSAGDFEAAYTRIHSPLPHKAEGKPPVYFCFLDEDRIPKNDPRGLSSFEHEAAFIARKIREMVDRAYSLPDRNTGGERPCVYGDFAVLQRSYTHQQALENYFKEFGIPFNADRPAGIFSDAPINDLYNLLRLLAYPEDRIAYAALLRSPFMRLSDLTLSVCMLDESGVPFNEALEERVPPEERVLYRQARTRYQALTQAARGLSIPELITRLWYDEGYRYETIWSARSQGYAELFDLFFELARIVERRGKGLTDFVDYLEDLMNREERAEDMDITAERETGVRIMSIHKSKGLEFPVVFIYLGGSGGHANTNTQAVYFNQQWGLTINLPQAEELPENSGNYFFNLHKAEEEQKNTAELRRLLYVAMTRAENALFLTATLPRRTKEEKSRQDPEQAEDPENAGGSIPERLVELLAKKGDAPASSFLSLLLPVIGAGGDGPFFIQPIPPLSRDELRPRPARGGPSMREAAEGAAPLYQAAEPIATPSPEITSIPASGLSYALQVLQGIPEPEAAEGPDKTGEIDAVDRLLEGTGLGAADFGTIVHGLLAAHFTGTAPALPAGLAGQERRLPIQQAAQVMAEGFINSELGRLCQKAAYKEAEFPILTMVKVRGKPIPITGQIDLLFEWADAFYIIDFKTDRVEDPGRHLGQLAAYRRAVSEIFHKPVRCWLFYLRSGRGVDLTDQADQTDVEALAAAFTPGPAYITGNVRHS
jgi:ATP-dependent helicase/nuclease subunit A